MGTGMQDGSRVELIVHTPPGSGPASMAQALVAAVQEAGAYRRTWDIVHRAGEHGEEAMRALLDGRGRDDLLSTCTPSFLQTPLLKGLPFSYHDLTPLAQLVSDRYLLVVPVHGRVQSLEAFARDVRARRTRTGGYMAGGINHLVALALEGVWQADTEFVVLASAADLGPALGEGRIDWGIGTPGEVLSGLTGGSLLALAVLAPERLPRFPDVPPLSAAGTEINITLWRGLMGPPGLSAAQRTAWDAILHRAMQTAAWRAYLDKGALAPAYTDGVAFGGLLERELAWYREQLGRAGLLRAPAG